MGRRRGHPAHFKELAHLPLWWAEEPTHPDDVLGHARIAKAIAPIGVATGEHGANRVIFKQLLQAKAISFCQIDNCRLGGVNEILAVILHGGQVRRSRLPACRRGGPLRIRAAPAIFDPPPLSGSIESRVLEFVDHLHEHFDDPVVIRRGRYMAPTTPGYSITIKPQSRTKDPVPGRRDLAHVTVRPRTGV